MPEAVSQRGILNRLSRVGAVMIVAFGAVLLMPGLTDRAAAQLGSRFEKTHSQSQYVHRINLYDANENKIDPTDPDAPPYSPTYTCGKCHDYETISHGYHFNAMDADSAGGRPGEPWIWTGLRSGTQLPLSYREWEGTHDPSELGMSDWQFVLEFGRHMPGGGPGDPSADGEGDGEGSQEGRWDVAGKLAVDCMVCHAADRNYKLEAWADQIENQNFAWAPTAALGLAEIEGSVARLPADFDPEQAAGEGEGDGDGEQGDGGDGEDGPQLPRTKYDQDRFNSKGEVFFDIVGTPGNNACYRCHSERPVGESASLKWQHDQDIHLKAGLSCVDCHRNGIDHHTVRGFEGEKHPTGQSVETLSCRGCHMGTEGDEAVGELAALGGRLGSPKPEHKGIPPIHFEKLSCTSCHSGPVPGDRAGGVQTSMAHELGLPTQTRTEDQPPGIASPALLENDEGVIEPHRMVWPAFWGVLKDGEVTPLPPQEAYRSVRRGLRVRQSFQQEMGEARLSGSEKAEVLGEDRAEVGESELTEAERRKLDRRREAKAAEAFKQKLPRAFQGLKRRHRDGTVVYISGGKAYRMAEDGEGIETISYQQGDGPLAEAAAPYTWPLAHEVRPARQALGAKGCADCHSPDAPMQYGVVEAVGPAPDGDPPRTEMHSLQNNKAGLLSAWDQLFQGRWMLKIIGLTATAVLFAVVFLYTLLALRGVMAGLAGARQRAPAPPQASRAGDEAHHETA